MSRDRGRNPNGARHPSDQVAEMNRIVVALDVDSTAQAHLAAAATELAGVAPEAADRLTVNVPPLGA